MGFFKKKPLPKYKLKAGLALGGGGMRGFAHIGALKAFEQEQIEFEYVAGTSIGSLLGAFYGLNVKADDLIYAFKDFKLSEIHNKLLPIPDDAASIAKAFVDVVGNRTFDDLERKFIAVACDLVTAKEVLIDKGYLADAVAASCCVPVYFRPYVVGNMHLVDGGLLNNIPADVVRMMGAQEVVTVDINSSRGSGTDSLKLLDVISATFRIMSAASSNRGLLNSSIIVAPDLAKFSATSKEGWQEMIDIGYEAAIQKMPEIKKLILTNP